MVSKTGPDRPVKQLVSETFRGYEKIVRLDSLGGFMLRARAGPLISSRRSSRQVVNSVEVISSDQPATPPRSTAFSDTDVLRTGAASRAELVARRHTITRVGANTRFSFDPANRTIDLRQGSLLFIHRTARARDVHTGSATASVLGTTIVVTRAQRRLQGAGAGRRGGNPFFERAAHHLDAGQMTFVLPGAARRPS